MHHTWYSVYVGAQAPPGADPSVDDGAADELMDLLTEHSGVVSAGDTSWTATVSVTANDVRGAADVGAALVEGLARRAGMPAWPLVRCEAVREDVLAADNARPTLPEIVSVPEAADILGVSQQRARQLAAEQKDFPQPVYELRTGKLWLRAAVEAYAARRPRKPGRRSRAEESVTATGPESVIEAVRWRAAALVADSPRYQAPLRTEPPVSVYVIAKAVGQAYGQWYAWKAQLHRDLDPAAVSELSWTDVDADDLRQFLGGADSEVAQPSESFGSFARSQKQSLISLLSGALDVPAAESDELVNLALIEAASNWHEPAISASPGEWVLGYAVRLYRTRRSELPEEPATRSYSEPAQVSLRDTRVTGALALAAAAAAVADPRGHRIAQARHERPSDADRMMARLYTAHYRPLVRLAALLVRDIGAAEEVVQDSFIELHKAASHEGRRRLSSEEEALSSLRKEVVKRSRSVLRHRVVVDRNAAKPPPDMPSAELGAFALLERSAVLAALRQLPERQRQALVLRFYADMSEAQIADAMGISRKAAKSHTSRAAAALRSMLEDDE
jgi:RNA polymerase sigma factor (sigma-70 family)